MRIFSTITLLSLIIACSLAAEVSSAVEKRGLLDFDDRPTTSFYPSSANCQKDGELPPCNPWQEREDGEPPTCVMTKDGKICEVTYEQADKRDQKKAWTCYNLFNCIFKGRCPCGFWPQAVCSFDILYDPWIVLCGCQRDTTIYCESGIDPWVTTTRPTPPSSSTLSSLPSTTQSSVPASTTQ